MKKPAFLTSLFLAAGALASGFRSRQSKIESRQIGKSTLLPAAMIPQKGTNAGTSGSITSAWSYPYDRPAAAYGIPTPPPRNQRQRRKDFRQLLANGRA